MRTFPGAVLPLLGAGWACTTIVVPPPAPPTPSPVLLLDHGRHASLVLPAGGGRVVRYAYGDWEYYVRRRTGVTEATGAVLWPTRAGLGRRELEGPADPGAVREQVRVTIERLHVVNADSQDVAALRLHLDSIYEAGIETHVYNSVYELDFVHHPKSYWVFHNSNLVVAKWLKRLGCRIRGPLILSRWRVEPPPRK